MSLQGPPQNPLSHTGVGQELWSHTSIVRVSREDILYYCMFLLRLESVVLPPSELLKGTWSSKLKQLMPFDGQRLQEEMIQAVDDSGVLRDHLDEEGRVHMRRFLKNLLSDSYMVWDIVKGQVMYSGQQGGI